MDSVSQIENLIAITKIDLTTFAQKRTASSGTRARASLLKVKKLCDVCRKQILAETKSNKSKKSTLTVVAEVSDEEVVEAAVEEPPVVVKKTRKRKQKVAAV